MGVAAAVTVAAAAAYLMVGLASNIDERYLRTRFVTPPHACPLQYMRYSDPQPWCREDSWTP